MFERVLAGMEQAVIVTSLSGEVRYWNPAAELLYGYTSPEAVGRPVMDLIVPADGHAEAAGRVERLTQTSPHVDDWLLHDKAGRAFTAHATTSVLTDEQGTPVEVLSVSYDVSARRDAEAEARSLAEIVDGADDAIVRTDLDGTIETANRAVEAIFGYPPTELIGQNVVILVPLESRAQLVEAMAAITRGDSYDSFNALRLRRDGTTFEASVQLSPIRDTDGALTGVSRISRDVSADAHVRAQLIDSQRRVSTRFEQAPLAQVLLDLDGQVLSANEAFCSMLGRRRAEIESGAGKPLRHPSDDHDDSPLERIASGASEAETWERTFSDVDGSAVPSLVQASLLRTTTGEPYLIECFVQDLSSLHLARNELLVRDVLFDTVGRKATEFSVILDREAHFSAVTPSMGRAFGYEQSALLGEYALSYVHEEDQEKVAEAFDRVVATAGHSESLLLRVVDGAGRWRWVETVLSNYLALPGIDGIVCNGSDVTVRVNAAAELRASEARYLSVATTSLEGIWTVDSNLRTIHVNQRMAEILGIPLAVLLTSSPALVIGGVDRQHHFEDQMSRRGSWVPTGTRSPTPTRTASRASSASA